LLSLHTWSTITSLVGQRKTLLEDSSVVVKIQLQKISREDG
jgi:hypothetical protein